MEPFEIQKRYFLRTNYCSKPPIIKDREVSICCPICREGKSWNRKQRCHLYYDNRIKRFLVHCFNCGFKGTLKKFLREVNVSLYYQYRDELKTYALDELKQKTLEKDKIREQEIDQNREKEQEKESFILFDMPSQFIPAKESQRALQYLLQRKLPLDEFYYSPVDIELDGKFLPVEDSIIIPLWYQNRLYGFQSRKVEEKRFYTYLPNPGYKVWNYFYVQEPVFAFESVFDALSSGLPKSKIVANLGILFPFSLFEKKRVIFCPDNQNIDKTAREFSIEMLEKGYEVFIWPREFQGVRIIEKDFNELLQRIERQFIATMILKNIKKGIQPIIELKLKGV